MDRYELNNFGLTGEPEERGTSLAKLVKRQTGIACEDKVGRRNDQAGSNRVIETCARKDGRRVVEEGVEPRQLLRPHHATGGDQGSSVVGLSESEDESLAERVGLLEGLDDGDGRLHDSNLEVDGVRRGVTVDDRERGVSFVYAVLKEGVSRRLG